MTDNDKHSIENTKAYNVKAKITAVISFIVQATNIS